MAWVTRPVAILQQNVGREGEEQTAHPAGSGCLTKSFAIQAKAQAEPTRVARMKRLWPSTGPQRPEGARPGRRR